MKITQPAGLRRILEASRKPCAKISNEELAERMERHAGTEAARALDRPYPGETMPSRSLVQTHFSPAPED